MEDVDGFYVFDPHSGIVCTACKVSVRMKEGRSPSYFIRIHESLKIHVDSGQRTTTKPEQEFISAKFMSFIVKCVADVQKCLPCIDAANKKFILLVGTPQLYDYCSKCKVLSSDSTNHNSRLCRGCFGEKKNGVKNAHNIHMNPSIIIVDDFKINDNESVQKYTCIHFAKQWSTIMAPQKVDRVLEMLQQQQHRLENFRQNEEIRAIDNKRTPNLYATSLSWDAALAGCQLTVINAMKVADCHGNFENNLASTMQCFDDSLWYALQLSSTIHPPHPALCELGTRDSGDTKPPLILKKNKTTWKNYFHSVKTICLLLFRIHDQGNHFHQNENKLPKIIFTNEQQALMDKCREYANCIDKSNNGDVNDRYEVHLDFLLSLLRQKIGYCTYECPLIGALAMLAVERTSFSSSTNLSSKVAGITTVYRMLLVYDCIHKCRDMDSAGDSDNHIETKSIESYARENAARYLHTNGNKYCSNPCRELLKCLAIIKRESDGTKAKDILAWSADEQTVTYLGKVTISMMEIRSKVHSAVCSANEVLFKMVGYPSLPKIPWDDIADDPMNNKSGFSFLNDVRNQHWMCKEFYFGKIYETKRSWWDSEGSLDTGKNGPFMFERLIDEFRSLLVSLIHISAGAPARGPELVSITFENPTECVRNIFVERGCVHIRTLYHKCMIQHQSYQNISRYLHRDVGELLVYYLWLVLPFWQAVKGMMTIGNTKLSPFLFGNDLIASVDGEDKLWDTDKLSGLLRSFFGKNVSVRSYRQIAIGIFNKKIENQN